MIPHNHQPVESMRQPLMAEQKWQAFQRLGKEVVEDHQKEIAPPAWHENIHLNLRPLTCCAAL